MEVMINTGFMPMESRGGAVAQLSLADINILIFSIAASYPIF
jgi:hypothetical protein